MKPRRIRLSRTKGFRLQLASRALNGLAACNCARPGKWGNPYRADPAYADDYCRMAVAIHRDHIENALANWPSMREALAELAGHNLACWCRLCEAHAAGKPLGITCEACAPCHADTLLELANPQEA